MRLFAAVSLDPSVASALTAAVSTLAGSVPGLTRVRAEALHLTLRFYGEVPDDAAAGLRGLFARRLATRASRVVVGGYGQFPGRGAPRVLYAGLRTGGETVQDLWREIRDLTAGYGEPPEPGYTPHVTLARDKSGALRGRARELEAFRGVVDSLSLDTTADRVRLYRSEPGGAGPRYTVLGEALCAP